jgi:hypothetical protein
LLTKIVLGVIIGVVGFIAACTGGLFLWVYVGTADSAERADSFLASLAQGDVRAAYAQTATAFRHEQDDRQFADVVGKAGIAGYELPSWKDRTLDRNGRNTYFGSVNAEGRRSMPFILEILREGGEWRVLTFTGPGRADVGPGAWFRQTPEPPEMTALVLQSMRDFELAVSSKNFDDLFRTMYTYRPETSPVVLEAAYREYLDEGVDLSGVRGLAPVFTEASQIVRSPSGTLLVATGRFPVEGAPVPFRFRYKYVHPGWSLYNIDVGRPGDPDLEPE